MSKTQTFIRIATASDAGKLRGMFARSSPQTVYKRFHIPYPEVPEWMVTLMLGTVHDEGEALVAVAEGNVVGHAMYVRLGDSAEAEMAIIVEDGWQSMGLGKSLLSELARKAKARGIETFTAEVLATNRPMLGLASTFVGTDHTIQGGTYHVRIPLPKPEPASAAGAVPRAA